MGGALTTNLHEIVVSLDTAMRKLIILLFCIIPFFAHAQRDVLVLQKRGMHVRAYTVGDQLIFRTIYDQWFTGVIDDMRRDTIYISGQAFSYKEIDAIQRARKGSDLGKTMLLAGGGFIVISAVNGLLRKDAAKDWFTNSGYIIGGGLLDGVQFKSLDAIAAKNIFQTFFVAIAILQTRKTTGCLSTQKD